jgi:anthranilate phosphoribosyltransferase
VYTVTPEQFGMTRADLAAITVTDAQRSLEMIRGVLAGQAGPARDIVALNAGAAIYAAGVADSLAAGVEQAAGVLRNGKAAQTLELLVEISNSV